MTNPTPREELLLKAAKIGADCLWHMYHSTDTEELKRLDKVAARVNSFMGSIARFRTTEELLLASPSPVAAIGGSQEQEGA